MMGLGLFILFFVVLIIAVIYIRNSIVRHYNAAQRAWADVATYERQKVKVLDGLVPLVEQYAGFEKSTLELNYVSRLCNLILKALISLSYNG
jgi:LemA protein